MLGATGRIGSAVVAEALRRGHRVTAVVRDGSTIAARAHLAVSAGPFDADRLTAAFEGVTAVIGAVGPRNHEGATAELTAILNDTLTAMRRTGCRRLVLISGAAVRAPGDNRGPFHEAAAFVVRRAIPHLVRAKQAELDALRASDVEWVAVRPVGVRAGPPGSVRVSERRPPGLSIAVGDVARFMLDACDSDAWVRRAPFVAS